MYSGIVAATMTLNVNPQIRYLSNSDACFYLADKLAQKF
jgi:hypothetical protein